MRDYAELVKALNEISDKTSCYYCHGESLDCKTAGCYISDAADAIEELRRNLKDCRNELCLKCGEYKQRHLGACDGCRWKEPIE